MSSVQSLKAPSLVSKKTQKQIQTDDDDVMIDPNALPSQRSEAMDAEEEHQEGSEAAAKPAFGAASAAELNVRKVSLYKVLDIYGQSLYIDGDKRPSKNPHSPSPHVTSQTQLDGNLLAPCGTHEVTSTNECQISNGGTSSK
jgi:hypothetical protein